MTIYHFYRIVCRDISVTDCYVGSTKDFGPRRAAHKLSCKSKTHTNYHLPVYRVIRDNGNWANWSMVLIESASFETKMEALRRERDYIERYRATLNSRVPGRSDAQYYAENREAINARRKTQCYCPCGGRFTHINRAKHYRSQKHQAYLDSGIEISSQPANILAEGKSKNMNECGSV
jgi:hypothetical protein